MSIDIDIRNGYGFLYYEGSELCPEKDGPDLSFPEDAEEVINLVNETGSVCVEGAPGAGKSHLINDLFRVASSEERPTLVLLAHVSASSKKGALNAGYVLDEFLMRHPDGLLIIDNVDYYGYSGSKNSKRGRRYSIAEAHLDVINRIEEAMARHIGVCGLAHTQIWRDSHWLYSEHKAETDLVTSAAQKLLDSFSLVYSFEGEISEYVARHLLHKKCIDLSIDASVIEDILSYLKERTGSIYFRHVNHLNIELFIVDADEEIKKIDEGTMQRLAID